MRLTFLRGVSSKTSVPASRAREDEVVEDRPGKPEFWEGGLRKGDADGGAVQGYEPDSLQDGVGAGQDAFLKAELFEHRPCEWIQAVTTHLFARESTPLEKQNAAPSSSTQRGTSGARRAAANDGNVIHRQIS